MNVLPQDYFYLAAFLSSLVLIRTKEPTFWFIGAASLFTGIIISFFNMGV